MPRSKLLRSKLRDEAAYWTPGPARTAPKGSLTIGNSDKQRLDKWIWFARVVKTRTLAAKLVLDGHVRVNAQRIETPAKPVGPGDVLTIALESRIVVLRIVALGTRRGPFSEARLLFEDIGGDGGIGK